MLASGVRKSVVVLLVLGIGAAVSVFAQAPPRSTAPAQARPIKIGVIDTEKILTTSNAAKRAVAGYKVQTTQAETDLQKMKDAGVTAEAIRQAQEQATRDLTAKRDKMLSQIDEMVMPVINQIGKDLGYTLIFRKFESGLIYADETTDITDIVIQRLDAAGKR